MEEEKRETYIVDRVCCNCGSEFKGGLEIPKGDTVEYFLIGNEIACPTCGCFMEY